MNKAAAILKTGDSNLLVLAVKESLIRSFRTCLKCLYIVYKADGKA